MSRLIAIDGDKEERWKATKRRKARTRCGTQSGGRIAFGCYHNCTLTLSHCFVHPRGHLPSPIIAKDRIFFFFFFHELSSIRVAKAESRDQLEKKEGDRYGREEREGKFWKIISRVGDDKNRGSKR